MTVWIASVFLLAGADAPARVEFSRDVRPLLSDTCYACHGPDDLQRKADLRLDLRDGLFPTKDSTLIVPGKPEESELYRRLTAEDPAERMPPEKAGRQLTPAQIDTIKRWIQQGAEWQGHWAYVAPVQPAVPDVGPSEFVRNDIDRFILAKLKEQGLAPSPTADPVTLVRRLAFDLTGLPPQPGDVEAFARDPSPAKYEALVDRLLASPHYGERMAVHWLDLVRYADTTGIHGDNHRDISMFRDWTIAAFQQNQPFDQFTIEQLAGDLLPQPTHAQKIASGYNHLLMTTREGGAQAKEYLAKYAADRVRNVGSVWLAGTIGCAECHNHKFDPFTIKDFYSFQAFFADIQEVAVGEQPQTAIPTAEQVAQIAAINQDLDPLRTQLNTATPELAAAQKKWESDLKDRKVAWTVLTPAEATSKGGATLVVQNDGSVLASGPNPENDTFTVKVKTDLQGISAIRLEILPDDTLPSKGPGRADNGNIVLNEFELHVGGQLRIWSAATATFSQPNYPIDAAADRNMDPLKGWAIYDQVAKPLSAVFELKEDVGTGEATELVFTFHQNYGRRHSIGHWRLSATTATRPVREGEALPANLKAILALEPAQRTPAQQTELATAFRAVAPELAYVRRKIIELEERRRTIELAAPKTLVATAVAPRMMRVLPRGNWLDETGEVVNPVTPEFLPPLGEVSGRATRLDLARWIVSKENPLTARVFVNRLWKLTFGQGLVRSLDDFGAQGTPPTHPQLLDWLALDFAEHGWDVKRALKQIVMSGTYRQASRPAPELVARDPDNRWLARQGRFRLEAEFVRDNALAVSGLLVEQVGGPSVRPYQPAGFWDYLNFPRRTYDNDQGASQYRRGLYTYWCRTFLHPSLRAFDASTREECAVERPRSNTPLQALVLLNDPSYVEAARAFAERILKDGGATTESRLTFAFRQALSRPPRLQETEVLTQLLVKHLADYQAHPEQAKELLTVGARPAPAENQPELAAWTSIARVILNLHETITRN